MRWLGWWRANAAGDSRLQDWRRAWAEAAAAPTAAGAAALRARLDEVARDAPSDDLEIEREMLEALDGAVELTGRLAADRVPVVATGHRAAGADPCHFSAPASLPDDPAQRAGTLLLTGTRAVFVGGARASAVAWHAVSRSERIDRDLLLVRRDAADVLRIRFNSYEEALRAAVLAAHLARRRRI